MQAFRTQRGYRRGVAVLLVALAAATAGCAWRAPPPAGIGAAVAWSQLDGWSEDDHAAAWPALRRGCARTAALGDAWRRICAAAAAQPAPSDAEARRFFETHFVAHRIHGDDGAADGLVTGYYVPLLRGHVAPTPRFRYPLYAPPPDLLHVDLAAVIPSLAERRVRARLADGRVVPYYSRAQIDGAERLLAGHELLWVDDAEALFFLHIQGSGRVRLRDGGVVGVGYADHNGHPYRAIGAELVARGELRREDVDLFTIRQWLREHPDGVAELFNSNPSYIFFALRDTPDEGPIGTLGVALTPERSVAVDAAAIPLGTPLWLETTLPDEQVSPYRRLVLAQDTGGAIKGPTRADLFWGEGVRAERMAGLMKQRGRLFALLPRAQASP